VRRTVAGVVLVLITGVVVSSHADVLCTTRSGALRVRQTCKRREKPVDLTTLGPVGAPGAPGDPGAPGPAGQLIDAAGQRLSPTLFAEEEFGTVLRIGDVVVGTAVHTDRFSTFVRLVYEASNCAGAPLVQAFNGLLRPAFFMGSTAYYAGDPIQSRVTMSYASTSTAGDCMLAGGTFNAGFCCFNDSSPSTVPAGPAVSVDVSGLVSRFPLSIAVVP
jgi:hypothetical protein